MNKIPSLTTSDVAKLEKTTPATVRVWINSGELKAYRTGGTTGSWRIRPERYEEFIKAREAMRRDPWAGGLSHRRNQA